MHEQDEPNLLRVLDETEKFRKERVAELNAVGWPKEVLEGTYGKVWSSDELREQFEVVGFFAPLVVVKSRASGQLGSFEFQHAPRFYFNHVEDR